ncbi:MAG TPA: c-type cytochrome [Marinobacter sp.]|nr:c-type cytochrome [Marinobacter sp.]
MSQARKLISLMAVIGLGLAASGFAQSQSSVNKDIADRIAPVGSVCMAGDDCAAAPVAVVASGPRSGKEIYDASCNMCHGAGVAGAPRLGDADAWAERMASGIETVYTNAINGLGGMPAMGLCATCSEDDIKAAVDYMVE